MEEDMVTRTKGKLIYYTKENYEAIQRNDLL